MGMTSNYPLGGYALIENLVSGALETDIENTTPVLLIEAPAANKRIFLTNIMVTNNNEDVATVVKLTDGLDGEVRWRGNASEAGGGWVVMLQVPVEFTAGNGVYVVCETEGASVQANAAGFVG